MAKMMNAKLEVEKFTCNNKFSYGNRKLGIFLCNKGCKKQSDRVNKKPTSMIDTDSEDLDTQALSTIRLCLADEFLFNIVEESTNPCLWENWKNCI